GHLHQVHDHRGAVAETLTDGAGLAVLARAQRGDLRHPAGLVEQRGTRARRALGADLTVRIDGQGPAGGRRRGHGRTPPVGRLVVVVVLVVVAAAWAGPVPAAARIAVVRALPPVEVVDVVVLVILHRHHAEVGLELLQTAHRSTFLGCGWDRCGEVF